MRGANRLHHPRGWTLLEILLVILVIGILAALALPVFSRARERAIQAVCKSHLKQLGLAVRLYLQYNDSIYFPYEVETDEGTLYYYGLETPSPDGDGVELDVTRGYLFPYYSLVEGVGSCPAFNLPASPRRTRGAALGYGYNRFGVAGLRSAAVGNPENIILFADCARVVRRTSTIGARLVVEEFHYVSPCDFTVHFRHGGQGNFLFCDGHVEARYPKRILPVLPDAQVGMVNELGDTSLFIP